MQKVFFDGQIFDAFLLLADIVEEAQSSITLIDGNKGYHIGASIKDTGKKCFGINRLADVGLINSIIQKAQSTGKQV